MDTKRDILLKVWRSLFSRTNPLGYDALVLIIIGLFFVASLILGRHATCRYEQLFNEQQAALARLAGYAVRDHIGMLVSEVGILARHALPEFAQGQRDIGAIADRFQSGLSAHPDILAYTVVDGAGELIYARGAETAAGDLGVNLSLQWAQQYWPEIEMLRDGPFVPPFHITPERQLLGLLFPVHTPELSGALVVIVDIKPLANGLIAPLHLGQAGEMCLVDGRGQIVYHPQPAMIGRGAERIMLPRRLFAEQTGFGIFSAPGQRRLFPGQDTLIAWDTVPIGGEKMVVAIATSDGAVDRVMDDLRLQCVVSGTIFLLLLLILGIKYGVIRWRNPK